jgi:hypothetical protein
MGKKGQESTSNALAVTLDSEGKVKYDVLARQGHGKNKVRFLQYMNGLFVTITTVIRLLNLY